ncbi:MAG: FG-GAP-like repeat-containing protein [Myxococcota bacterium]|nr:FG-GAP-like repeat-containing protein [Myxococcota bacterium]
MPHREFSVVLLLAACSDYNFTEKDDPEAGAETGTPSDEDDEASVDVDACSEAEEPPPGTVVLNEECETEFQGGSFTPTVEWTYGSVDFCGPAAVAPTIDTDGSGVIDDGDVPMVFLYQYNAVHAVRGDTGAVQWTSASLGNDYGGMAVGDVDGDGQPDVVTAGVSSVCAIDGSNGQQLWCNNSLFGSMDPYGYNYPAIADMDGDGFAEVTMGSAILDGSNGTLRGLGQYGIGAAVYYGAVGTYGAMSVPIDLDGDGLLELVTGNAAYNIDGSVKWYNGTSDGIVAVADFDGDGAGEIVKTSGARVTGMDTDGTVLWEVGYENGSYLAIGAPAVDDIDGDGIPDIVFAAQNQLIAMAWGGATKWTQTISDASGAAGPSLFDFEMDGYPEVLYADETTIRFFNGLDGSTKFSSTEHGSVTILETPIVADIDNDDEVEIVVAHCSFGGRTGITVFGDANNSWPPGRKVWNQHAYNITNVGDLGDIPSATPPNWPEYNSFRSGDVGLPPSEYLDLVGEVLDVCEDECEQGLLYVAARVGNAGNVEAPAGIEVALRAGAGGPIVATAMLSTPIASGTTSEMVVFEVASADMAGTDPVVVANLDASGVSAVYECDTTNNADNGGNPVCE